MDELLESVDEYMPQLLPACRASYRISDGSIFSVRGRMTTVEWGEECRAVANHLGIGIEQHWGSSSTEYSVKIIEEPHRGLLGKRIIYWLNQDFRPQAGAAQGTLIACLYLHQADPSAYNQPVLLHLEGYDASYVAWAEMRENGIDDQDPEHFKSWSTTAKGLLNKWRVQVADKLHQVS